MMKERNAYLTTLALLFCLVLCGCATTSKHPGMVYFELEPSCDYQKDSTVDFSQYNTFSVAKSKEDTSDINLIAEKQINFMVRNILEYSGYEYNSDFKNSDLIIIPRYSNEYKSIYVPPSNYTIPWRIPGQTQTTNFNFYGDLTTWGTATTKTPDNYVPMTFTSPGGHEGYFFPFVQILAYDRKTQSLIWSGTICNATKEPNIRLSMQVLLGYLLYGKKTEPNFPPNLKRVKQDDKGSGAFGFIATPITLDGNNFYLRINSIVVNSPANKQNLRPGDLIISIDKQATLNWSFSKLLETLDKDVGQPLELTIKRDDKIFEATLIAEDEIIARNNWKEGLSLDGQGRIKKTKLISN